MIGEEYGKGVGKASQVGGGGEEAGIDMANATVGGWQEELGSGGRVGRG